MVVTDFQFMSGVNVRRDATSRTLFVYYTSTGVIVDTFRLNLGLFAKLPNVGEKLVDNHYFQIAVEKDPRNPPDKIVEATLKSAAFDFGDGRTLGASFMDAISTLESLEGHGVAYGATPAIRAALALQTPATFAESLFLNYSYVSQSAGQKMGYVDLMPGMRVRLESQFSQLIPQAPANLTNGYVTAGTACFDVISTPDGPNGTPLLGFDAFLASLPIPAVLNATGGVGGLIDLRSESFRRRHLRVCYPTQFPAGDTAGSPSPFQAAALIGADTLSGLAAATASYYAGQTPADPASIAFFRGRTVLVPEVLAFVNSTPGFVPIGTTCRNLLARYVLMPRVLGLRIPQFRDRYTRYLPLVENAGGTNASAWSNVYPPDDGDPGPGPLDVFDFPVLAGDAMRTGNAV